MMMMTGRRTLALRPAAIRNFSSSLLVPLATKAEVPAEIESNSISEYAHNQLLE